jgi:hypothetical protein
MPSTNPSPNCLLRPSPARLLAARHSSYTNHTLQAILSPTSAMYEKLGIPCQANGVEAAIHALDCLRQVCMFQHLSPPVANRLPDLIAVDQHVLTRLCALLYGVPVFGCTVREASGVRPGKAAPTSISTRTSDATVASGESPE